MSHVPTAPVKYAGRSYIVECFVVMGLYVAAVWVRPDVLAHVSNPDLKVAVEVSPALPIWLMLGVVWRYYRRIDEYEQKKLLETLAVAFGIGSCLIVTYSFLADAGLPALALTWAWPTLAVSWGLTTAIRSMADWK